MFHAIKIKIEREVGTEAKAEIETLGTKSHRQVFQPLQTKLSVELIKNS